ncbi:MMPL family transporter [Asanoa sp. WMMD1127]|uniref:MMPL family transporter n=1 Tax=Asanoa sp. WMMD1127 TaxID=3016107 RepID=UPI00241601E2|nr:MMPL family transporter [Asanoa sp. WMMD1127]MDG4823610.1 MMPL family transporter [Asanoa sp. WMMD1127]
MFAWWGRAVVRFRWGVLAAAAVLVLVGAAWGSGVFGSLTGGGFEDPNAESTQFRERTIAELGNQDVDVLVLYSSPTVVVDDPSFRDPVTATLTKVRALPEVASVTSFYDTQSPALVSGDRRSTYAMVQLRATDPDGKTTAYEAIEPELAAAGITTRTGGTIPFLHEANKQTSEDLARAEMFSLPVLLVLLILIFGGLAAAATPLMIGGIAILGSLVVVRLINMITDVSVFAINIITLIGLGMAVDYALFIVSRFREELAAGHEPPAAIARTMATAGRTVLVSGLTIALALASLLIFPQSFLRSMGFGGLAAVLVAMLAALTALPALLAVLGHRINALRIPLPWRRGGERASGDGAWARIARSVMRRPIVYAAGVIVVLAVLASPVLRIGFGGFDERVLPPGAEPRVVSDAISADFAGGTVGPIEVLVSGGGEAEAQRLASTIGTLPDVTGVQPSAEAGGSTLLNVTYEGESTGDAAQGVVRAIRDLPEPAGVDILVGGRTAADLDLIDSLVAHLPWMALIMASATLILLFLAFGSIVLPIKAVLMNLVSIGASFGVVVWIFQDGHFADFLGFTPTGFIEPSNPILMLAVLFGLATDYEVFLLSRVREEWDRTGDNTASVATGLQHTGRIITAAALLLIVVVAGFASGGIAFIKLIGIGMIVAIIVDATLVRLLLVPATMRLLGRWNWWAPGPLGAIYRRFGIRELEPHPGAPAKEEALAGTSGPS